MTSKKRFILTVIMVACLGSSIELHHALIAPQVMAQFSASEGLSYSFLGRSIPLLVRQDLLAVDFKATAGTRGVDVPLYQKLQQDLQGGVRSLETAPEVEPLSQRYALIKLPSGSRDLGNSLRQRIQQLPYVKAALPVLTRGDRHEALVLPNEIIVSFTSEFAAAPKAQTLLKAYGLDILRPLRFTKNRYIVTAKTASGTEILSIANRLNHERGVVSATPNFIESVPYRVDNDAPFNLPLDDLTQTNRQPSAQPLSNIIRQSPFTSNLLPLEWHLNSQPMQGSAARTDIHAVEAWQNSRRGEGVVVAVIDSLIQWDHPDLVQNIYEAKTIKNLLPGETHGWDFTQNDSDTRLSQSELSQLQPAFGETFQPNNAAILKRYPKLLNAYRSRYPNLSDAEIAQRIRQRVRAEVAGEFHGTMTSGVVAASAQQGQGAIGVAPRAKILPIRVFGLNGAIKTEWMVEALYYAAERGADVINMSLGGSVPTTEEVDAIFDILDAHPKLVIVASAGNENLDGVAFPAGIPGVLSVGATNLEGERSPYSSYGGRLDLVAPGGDTSKLLRGGILTLGGTFSDGFWQGIKVPNHAWGYAYDPKGQYVFAQGTSFSAPATAGVLALMKGEDPKRKLSREQLLAILKKTSSYEGLKVSSGDTRQYRLQSVLGFGTADDFKFVRPSGIFPLPPAISAQQYFFGSGLVNAAKAVLAVQQLQ